MLFKINISEVSLRCFFAVCGVMAFITAPAHAIFINPVIHASQESCTAPCSVNFDGSDTQVEGIPEVTSSFTDLSYSWNFGDPARTLWPTNGRRMNTALGPVTAHVYNRTGTYTATLIVRAPGGHSATMTKTIVVQHPDTVYSGSGTVCISQSGNFSECPAGAVQRTTMPSSFASNTRYLFKKGETFSNVSISLTASGIQLGSYGIGANPVFSAGVNTAISLSSQSTPDFQNVTIRDISIVGNGLGIGIVANGGVRNVLLLRLSFSNLRSGIEMSPSIIDWHNTHGFPGHHLFNGVAVVNSIFFGIVNNGYPIYMAGQNSAIIGNMITNPNPTNGQPASQHNIRIPIFARSVISDNAILEGTSNHHLVKLHAANFGSGGLAAEHPFSERIVISRNIFRGGDDSWGVMICTENNDLDQRLRQIVVTQNTFKPTRSEIVPLLICSQGDTSVNNNIFDLGGSSANLAVRFMRRGVEPSPTGLSVYNNTAYKGSAFAFLEISSQASAVKIRNNLINGAQGSALYSGPSSAVTDLGSNLTTATPQLEAPASGNFHLLSDSAAINAGTPTNSAVAGIDFATAARDQNYDIGAFEFMN